jgi:hypothetical protein
MSLEGNGHRVTDLIWIIVKVKQIKGLHWFFCDFFLFLKNDLYTGLYFKSLRTEVFREKKIRKCISPENGWNEEYNGTIRKCSSRAFQWMVMWVCFVNLKFFEQFLCPTFGDFCHHQSLIAWSIFFFTFSVKVSSTVCNVSNFALTP